MPRSSAALQQHQLPCIPLFLSSPFTDFSIHLFFFHRCIDFSSLASSYSSLLLEVEPYSKRENFGQTLFGGGLRPQATGHRPQATFGRKRPTATGHRPTLVGSGHRPQGTGHLWSEAANGHRPQATGHRPPLVGSGQRPQATGHRPQATGHRPPLVGSGQRPQATFDQRPP